MTFFEVLTGMAFAAFADAPVDVAVLEVGLGGLWDATNVVHAGTAWCCRSGSTTCRCSARRWPRSPPRRPGSSTRARRVVMAAQPPEAAEVLLRRCAEVGATVAREGLEFGVVERRTAVGGQLLTLQGLAGTYDDVFLPLHGAHQAQNAAAALAAVEAFLGGAGGARRRRRPRGLRPRPTSPGRLEVLRTSPTVLVDAAHNPPAWPRPCAALADAFPFTALVAVVACLARQGRPRRCSRCSSRPSRAVVVTTRRARRARCRSTSCASSPMDVFGEERVDVEDRLDDAIDTAVALAEEDGELRRRRACSSPAPWSPRGRPARCCAGPTGRAGAAR